MIRELEGTATECGLFLNLVALLLLTDDFCGVGTLVQAPNYSVVPLECDNISRRALAPRKVVLFLILHFCVCEEFKTSWLLLFSSREAILVVTWIKCDWMLLSNFDWTAVIYNIKSFDTFLNVFVTPLFFTNVIIWTEAVKVNIWTWWCGFKRSS